MIVFTRIQLGSRIYPTIYFKKTLCCWSDQTIHIWNVVPILCCLKQHGHQSHQRWLWRRGARAERGTGGEKRMTRRELKASDIFHFSRVANIFLVLDDRSDYMKRKYCNSSSLFIAFGSEFCLLSSRNSKYSVFIDLIRWNFASNRTCFAYC